jgi:type I restriction enzyme, S subunit
VIVSRQLGDLLIQNHESIKTGPSGAYRNVGLMNRGRGLFAKPTIRGGETSAKFLYPLRRGQVVYSKLFAWEGSVAIVGAEFEDCFVSAEFPHFDVVSEELDVNYLAHVLASDFFFNLLGVAATGMGQRRQRVNVDAFFSLRIPVPSLNEQQAISRKLSSISTAASKTEGRIVGRSAVIEGLREKIVYADPKVAPRRLSELLVETLDQAHVIAGAMYPSAGVRNRSRGLFVGSVITSGSTKYSVLRRIHAGEIIYSKLKAFEGAIAVVPEDYDGFHTSHEFPTFKVRKDRADVVFLSHLFATRRFGELLAGASKGVGARRERLAPKDFLSLRVPLPELSVQRSVASHLDSLRQANDLGAKQLEIAQALPRAARNEVFAKLV